MPRPPNEQQKREAERRERYERERFQDRQLSQEPLQKKESAESSARSKEGQLSSKDGVENAPESTRQSLQRLREIAKEQKAEGEGKGSVGGEAATTTGQQLTAQLLREAWKNLMPSLGLTLFYLNFHLLERWAGVPLPRNLFVEFGKEWPLGRGLPLPAGLIGLLEILVILFIDFLIVAAILGVIAVIVLIVTAYLHPIDTARQLLGAGVISIKTLYNLIRAGFGGAVE